MTLYDASCVNITHKMLRLQFSDPNGFLAAAFQMGSGYSGCTVAARATAVSEPKHVDN